jgi:hypothetical protein
MRLPEGSPRNKVRISSRKRLSVCRVRASADEGRLLERSGWSSSEATNSAARSASAASKRGCSVWGANSVHTADQADLQAEIEFLHPTRRTGAGRTPSISLTSPALAAWRHLSSAKHERRTGLSSTDVLANPLGQSKGSAAASSESSPSR